MLNNSKIFKKLNNFVYEIKKFQHMLFHRKALLKLKYNVTISKEKTNLSNRFYSKISNILNKKNLEKIKTDSVWLHISSLYHKTFLNNVTNDKTKLKLILDNPSKYNLFYGFDNNCEFLLKRPRKIDWYENDELVIDKILNLAEYFSVIRHNNPEQYKGSGRFLKPSIESLIDKIEEKLSIKLKFKNVFPGDEGIETKRGILTNREIQAIYQAYKINKISKKNNYSTILEIGAGLGRTAYYCYRFGLKNYTITDLLVPRICQLNYLSRVLNEKIILDESELKFQNTDNSIKIISPEYLFKTNKKFDLVFNSDSLTEIDAVNQKKYVNFISRNTKTFFSINHESNSKTVTELFSKTKFKEYDKALYWLRRGYLEEQFKFN